MKQAMDAIYENGSFRPLQRDALMFPDGQRVRITIEDQDEPEALRLAVGVYAGLSADEIDEIERIALDRGEFFSGRSAD